MNVHGSQGPGALPSSGTGPLSDRSIGTGPGVLCRWWVGALLVVAALMLGTLDTPWIAEDAAILARVHNSPPAQDLTGPQFGLHLVRFWRPMVSLSWWIQEHLTGIDPVPLRLFNLLLQGLAVILLGWVVRALGGGWLAALLAACLAATFPAQGGTVTWLAGRTDGMVAVLFGAAVLSALHERRWLAATWVLFACATKEFAFVLPAWIALLAWSRGGHPRLVWRTAWPSFAVAAGALLVRRWAVGSFTGGYVGGAGAISAANLGAGLWHGVEGLAPLLVLLALSVALGGSLGIWRWRVVVAGIGCGLSGLAPLLPLLLAAPLGPQNVRLLWVSELGFILATAGAWLDLERVRGWRLVLPVALVSCGIGLRAAAARVDVLEWSEAGWVGERAVRLARARAALDKPSPRPLFWDGFPATHRGAYCLGFGLADRFRAPFPASARPVWPLRTLFFDATRLRPRIARADKGGFRDPFDGAARQVADLEVRVDGLAPPVGDMDFFIPIDERVPHAASDRSPRVELTAAPPGALLEVVLLTEAGLESALGGRFDAEGRAALSMTEICGLANEVATVGQALYQVADLGATEAYLEIRALNEDGSLHSATRPLRLAWEADLLDRLDL